MSSKTLKLGDTLALPADEAVTQKYGASAVTSLRQRIVSRSPVSAAFAKLTGLNYIESQGPSLVKASAELFS